MLDTLDHDSYPHEEVGASAMEHENPELHSSSARFAVGCSSSQGRRPLHRSSLARDGTRWGNSIHRLVQNPQDGMELGSDLRIAIYAIPHRYDLKA